MGFEIFLTPLSHPDIRSWSDKYLASPPNGPSITGEIYYLVPSVIPPLLFATEITLEKRLDAVYHDSSTSMATVKNWFDDFQPSCTSVFDEPRAGAVKTAIREKNVMKFYHLVLADLWLLVFEIIEIVGHSNDRVNHITHETFGGHKAVSKMDGAFAHSGQQGQPWDHFRAVFNAVQALFKGVNSLFCDCRRNMDPLTHTTGQQTVETVDFTRRAGSEEVGDCSVDVKGDSYHFYDSKVLIYICCQEKVKRHRAVLSQKIGLAQCQIKECQLHLEKRTVLFHQNNQTTPTFPITRAKNGRIWLRTAAPPFNVPDLVCANFLSPNLNKSLPEHKRVSNKEFIAIMAVYFADPE